MNAYGDIAWPKEVARQSHRQRALWFLSAAVIFAAHAGAAYLMTRESAVPMILEAGSGAIEIDIAALGFSAADQVASEVDVAPPDPADVIEPGT